jgi:hypothetical protein
MSTVVKVVGNHRDCGLDCLCICYFGFECLFLQLSLLTLPQQFQYFQQTKTQIAALIGQPAADWLIEDAIYSFTLGGNDYINNYLVPFSTRSQQYTIPQYQDLLISTLYGHFQVCVKGRLEHHCPVQNQHFTSYPSF